MMPCPRTTSVLVLAACVGALAVGASPAAAHSGIFHAIVSLDPPIPTVGRHRATVELWDDEHARVAEAQVRVIVDAPGDHSPQLIESGPGLYGGEVTIGEGDQATLSIEAVLPAGRWRGSAALRIGSAAPPVRGLPVELRREGEAAVKPFGLAVGALALLAFAWGLALARRPAKPAARMRPVESKTERV